MTRHFKFLLVLTSLFCANSSLSGDVTLPNIFGDHMVLQQEKPIRFFGWAEPGESVTIECRGTKKEVTADGDGNWRVELPGMKADGKPFDVSIRGNNSITLKDVLLGEVWICSGQSNMEWSVRQSANPEEETAAANHPKIRLFNVPQHVTNTSPQNNVAGKWQVCSPQSVTNFTAVGYYFGRELLEKTDVPIGLIGTNWGGTRIEPWTPTHGFDGIDELKNYSDHLNKINPKTDAGRAYHSKYISQVEDWAKSAREKLDKGISPGAPPFKNDFGPIANATAIYNAMVHGMAPFSARGVIWYQGESNAGDGVRYQFMKQALVQGWRKSFEDDSLSFYWVQLAAFRAPGNDPAGGGWGPVREGQRRALEIPNSGMAVAIDVGNANDIHPKNKQDVGKRLARWAMHEHYDPNVIPSGPLYKQIKIENGKAIVSFEFVGDGLMIGEKKGMEPVTEIKDGRLNRFAIAGKDKVWKWAEAKIDGETVVIWSDEVPEPVAVRYGYESNPEGANLYNRAGLPASPFKTDNWNE